jgi:hypothetical protein
MRVLSKWLVSVLMAVSIVLFVGCAESKDEGGNQAVGDISGEEVLELSGTLYVGNDEKYNCELSSELGGSGILENNKLNFTIGKPDNNKLKDSFFAFDPLDDFDDGLLFDVNISPVNTKFAGLSVLKMVDVKSEEGSSLGVSKYSNEDIDEKFGDIFEAEEWYIYVDQDVVINGKGKTLDFGDGEIIFEDFNINLKKGWNSLFYWNFVEQYDNKDISIQTISTNNRGYNFWWNYKHLDEYVN